MWNFLDKLICAPAFMLGYFYRSQLAAFKWGSERYKQNLEKYGQ